MRRNLEIIVDPTLCVSNAQCVGLAPRSFQLDHEGLSTPLADRGDDDRTVMMAAASCPVAAITVRDADTGAEIHAEDDGRESGSL